MTATILDCGCGNGELAATLCNLGFRGHYTGTDSSAILLQIAREKTSSCANFQFFQADLANPDWDKTIQGKTYDVVFAFAVLHHIPSAKLRLNLLKSLRGHIKPGGWLAMSNWQFLNSPRLRKRIQDWSVIELSKQDVEAGDYLLDWRQGGKGYRYVHHFTDEELASLAQDAGFRVLETFLSDGEGGNLGLYQIWQLPD